MGWVRRVYGFDRLFIMSLIVALSLVVFWRADSDLDVINPMVDRLHELYVAGNISEVDYLRYSALLINARENIFLMGMLVFATLLNVAISMLLFYERSSREHG